MKEAVKMRKSKFAITCILCGNRDQSMAYFNFPVEKSERELWLKNCRLIDPSLRLGPQVKLCQNHFADDEIIVHKSGMRKLKEGTIPRFNLDRICNARSKKKHVRCVICGSSDNSAARSNHKFPKSSELCKKWLKNIGMENLALSSWVDPRLCSIHFAKEDIVTRPGGKRCFLRPGAVPLMFQDCTYPKFRCMLRSLRLNSTYCNSVDELCTSDQSSQKNNTSLATFIKNDDNATTESRKEYVFTEQSSSLSVDLSSISSSESECEDVICCTNESNAAVIYISDSENNECKASDISNISKKSTKIVNTSNDNGCSSSIRSTTSMEMNDGNKLLNERIVKISNIESSNPSNIHIKKKELVGPLNCDSHPRTTVSPSTLESSIADYKDRSTNLQLVPISSKKNVPKKKTYNVTNTSIQIIQTISPQLCEIPAKSLLSSPNEEMKRSNHATAIRTVDMNEADSTQNWGNTAAVEFETRKHKVKKSKRRRQLRQKLYDFQKVVHFLMEKDLVNTKGRRMIKKIQAKYADYY